jgi:hypothetical protein
MRRWALVSAVSLLAVLAIVSCFSPVDPDCSFICDSSNAFHCPDNFWCDHPDGGTSGFCTRQGFSGCAAKPSASDAGADGSADAGAGDMMTSGDGPGDLAPPVDVGAVDAMRD